MVLELKTGATYTQHSSIDSISINSDASHRRSHEFPVAESGYSSSTMQGSEDRVPFENFGNLTLKTVFLCTVGVLVVS